MDLAAIDLTMFWALRFTDDKVALKCNARQRFDESDRYLIVVNREVVNETSAANVHFYFNSVCCVAFVEIAHDVKAWSDNILILLTAIACAIAVNILALKCEVLASPSVT